MSNVHLLFTHALSPLHAGTGQSTGAIDLAIARDQATGIPFVPGSSIKGSLRDLATTAWGEKNLELKGIFGPDTRGASEHAGAVVFADANLLLLPVRAVAGTFAWITSPYLLGRFRRDLEEAGIEWEGGHLPAPTTFSDCIVASESALKLQLGGRPSVCFEDLDLRPSEAGDATPLAAAIGRLVFPGDEFWQQQFAKRFCVVHDDVMSFLARHGTQVSARIALEHERKTVRKGGLWYEESLPSETILVSLVLAVPVTKANITPEKAIERVRDLIETPVQLGGKGSVGRGRCRLVLTGAKV